MRPSREGGGGVAGSSSDDDGRGTPEPIVDYSCVTPFDDAVAEVERFLRETARALSLGTLDSHTELPLTFDFFFPFRASGQPERSRSGDDAEPSSLRPTNCVAELYTLPKSKALHPVHLHFGLSTFLVLRHDTHSLHVNQSDGIMLLSIGSCAAQSAGYPVPCFALVSADGEGLYRGSFQVPSTATVTTLINGNLALHKRWNRPTSDDDRAEAEPTEPVRYLIEAVAAHRNVAVAMPPRMFSATFQMAVAPLKTLFHPLHGAAPVTTLEGLIDTFRLNAGTTTKFVGAADGTSAVSANIQLQLSLRPPNGDQWAQFVREQLNGILSDASIPAHARVVLDATVPRSLHVNAAVIRRGAHRLRNAVPFLVGTSVCPFRCLVFDFEWTKLDVESPAIVDNAVRSSLLELCGERPDSVLRGDAVPCLPPGHVAIGVDWRAVSEVSSRSLDKALHYMDLLDDFIHGTASPTKRSPLENTNLVLDAETRLELHLDHVLPQALKPPTTDAAYSNSHDDGTVPRHILQRGHSLLERFASECSELHTVDEYYLLWLRTVDRVGRLLDQAEAQPALMPVLVSLLGGDGTLQLPTLTAHDVLMDKIHALTTCLRDEAWRREHQAAHHGAGSPLPAQSGEDGWGSDIDFESCSSGGDPDANEPAAMTAAPTMEGDTETVAHDSANPTSQAADTAALPARTLLCHPTISVTHPAQRRNAPVTRDVVAKATSALTSLGSTSEGQRRRTQLQMEALVADMQRFKHANQAQHRRVLLADFVRWHSPKDFIAAQWTPEWRPSSDDDLYGLDLLSVRMRPSAGETTNMWMDAWRTASAAALPTLAYEPVLEARQILRYLGLVEEGDVGSTVLHTVMEALAVASSESIATTLVLEDGTTEALPHIRSAFHQLRRRMHQQLETATSLEEGNARRSSHEQQEVATKDDEGEASLAPLSLRDRYGEALTTLHQMDILNSTASTLLKLFVPDAKCDATCRCFGKPNARIADRLLWLDGFIKRQWAASPWASSSPNAVPAPSDHSARTAVLGVLAHYPAHRPRVAVPIDLWRDTDMASLLLLSKSSTSSKQHYGIWSTSSGTAATAAPTLPLTVKEIPVPLASSGEDDSRVTLLMRRFEIEGYAQRPLPRPSSGRSDVLAPALSLQRLSSTLDFGTGDCHAAWMLSECP